MKHLKSLDSLRGIACLSVFLCHLTNEHNRYATFNIFASGNEAVILFFVLSGFVLTIGYKRSSAFTFVAYILKRLLRIYPAYYFAIFLAILCGLMSRIVTDNASLFYVNTFLLFPQTNLYNTLDSPAWSLAYEIIISVAVIPLLWQLMKFRKLFLGIVATMIMFALYVGYAVYIPSIKGFPIGDKIIGIPYYATFFALGILLHEYKDLFKNYVNKLFLFISVLLYLNFYFSFHYGSLVLTSLGSCGIILSAIFQPQFRKMLESKVILFYGKISFSFYILHIIIIQVLPQYLPSFIYPKSVVTLVVTTLLAYLSYQYIELPFMRFGNYLIRRKNII